MTHATPHRCGPYSAPSVLRQPACLVPTSTLTQSAFSNTCVGSINRRSCNCWGRSRRTISDRSTRAACHTTPPPLHSGASPRCALPRQAPLLLFYPHLLSLCGRSFMSWAVFEIGRSGGLCPAGSFRWTFLLLFIQVWCILLFVRYHCGNPFMFPRWQQKRTFPAFL